MVQNKLPLINSAHGSETRNIINELIKLFNGMGYTYNEALQKAHDTLNEAQRTNRLNNDTNARLDKIIADSGTSSTEVVDARGPFDILKNRLDDIDDRFNGVHINTLNPPADLNPIVPDANYFDEVNKKYYSDPEMTVPATDNRMAIQLMVDYLEERGGGTLLAPHGVICLRSGVKWKSKVSLIGAGMGNTKFVTEGYRFNLFYNLDMPGDGSGSIDEFLEDVRFEDFECDLIGLSDPAAHVHGKALFILGMRRARFNNLLLRNTIGTALGCDFLTETVIENVITYNAGRNWGVQADDGRMTIVGQSGIGVGTASQEEETLIIRDCHTYNSGNHGIFVEQQGSTGVRSRFAKIVDCYAEGNRIGFADKGSYETKFINCTSHKNKEYGFHFLQDSKGDEVKGCTVSNNGVDGILLDRGYDSDMTIFGNRIFGNGGRGIFSIVGTTERYPVRSDLVIKDNKIFENGLSGIDTQYKHSNLMINDNTVFNNNQNGSMSPSGDSGIVLSNIDGLNLIGNIVYDNQNVSTQRAGIRIGENITNFVIDNNRVNGNSVEQFYFKSNTKDGVIGLGNIGDSDDLIVRNYGEFTIPDGVLAANIYHGLLSKAEYVSLSFVGGQQAWINSNHNNYFRVQKERESGEVVVFWEAKI